MRLLICDNNRLLSLLLSKKLAVEGYDITVVGDGLSALKIINNGNIDFLITEIQVPYLSGLELLSNIKKKDNRIPVIILSEINSENIISQAYNMGADDYITKPFNPDVLPFRIKRVLLTL
ncbi:MAG: response regulator [Bacteroidota bacterium]|nr:response regulator [Bacteroidota bacterium]